MNPDVISGHRLNITAENDCRRLHCSLRDLSSLLQAVGRLAEYFIGDVFAARFNDALTVVERWVWEGESRSLRRYREQSSPLQ